MAARRTTKEEILNGTLAALLTERGIPCEAELFEKRKRMDIVAHADGFRVVIEAETGYRKHAQAIRDADRRLRQGLTVAVFALCYPDRVGAHELEDAEFHWLLRTRPDAPAGERFWSSGGIDDLASAVRQAPRAVPGVDAAAQALSDALDDAVSRLSTPTRRVLAGVLDLDHEVNVTTEDGFRTTAKRCLLVIATAMLFHHRLQGHLPALPPNALAQPWPPATASQCATAASTVISAHLEAWAAILQVDYRPIFETASAALSVIPTDTDSKETIYQLAQSVSNIADQVTGSRHDLLGRIFHRVLDTSRYDGSYYTSTAAAVLLAHLAIRREDQDWRDPNVLSRMRIGDPACGTGTLLMAAAERIRDLQGQLDEETAQAVDLCLVEDVLHGYDVNLTGAHMAATTLGMLSPSTKFGRMNIHRTLLGMYEGEPRIGSLEFLDGQPRLEEWPTTRQVRTRSERVGEETEAEAHTPPEMDLVIMNPPFTRSDIRYDQFAPEVEEALKGREKQIVANQPFQDAAPLFSSGGIFVALGTRMAKAVDGTLAMVLPLVAPTSPGNSDLRKFMAKHFHVETILSSHDPERIFFSENTNIGEVLIVCRRWPSDQERPPTRVINLAHNPATAAEALSIASQIEQGIEEHCTIQMVPADRIADGRWDAVNFFSPLLAAAYSAMSNGSAGGATFVPLQALADVGPQGRRIHDTYRKRMMPSESGRRALWHIKNDVTQTMAAHPDVYIEPIPAKQDLADAYWAQRSRLLLPHRLSFPQARVVSVLLNEPALGQQWAPCRPHGDQDDRLSMALCAYLNSAIGVLALLGDRRNKKPPYPSFALETLRHVPVPNLPALPASAVDRLVSAFREVAGEVLLPLCDMVNDAGRRHLDDAVADALQLDGEWVAAARRELAYEPSITNRRYRADSEDDQ